MGGLPASGGHGHQGLWGPGREVWSCQQVSHQDQWSGGEVGESGMDVGKETMSSRGGLEISCTVGASVAGGVHL